MSAPLLLLRLPSARALAPTGVVRLLAADRPWAEAEALAGRFALSSRERDFARELLDRKSNLRLWRCHQGAACGDFVVVDMAEPRPERRRAVVLELKCGGRLRLGGGHHQLRRAADAVQAVAQAGVLADPVAPQLAVGDRDAVLAWLGV